MQGKFHMELWNYIIEICLINDKTGNFYAKSKQFLPSMKQKHDNFNTYYFILQSSIH